MNHNFYEKWSFEECNWLIVFSLSITKKKQFDSFMPAYAGDSFMPAYAGWEIACDFELVAIFGYLLPLYGSS